MPVLSKVSKGNGIAATHRPHNRLHNRQHFLKLEKRFPHCPHFYFRSPYVKNSHHLARKYAWIFVCGHYLFREADSFPRVKLEKNCELQGTDNIQGQISEPIFALNGDYCLFYPSNLFFATRAFFKIGEYSRIFPSFGWGIFGHVTY